jgi:hypothetical protein
MVAVTCGDLAARQLREAGLADEVIVWRDILHEGPVPGDCGLDELSDIRAGYLAGLGWTTEAEARSDFRSRNERLVTVAAATPITLWFDDNLVNQLQLIQVLATLSTVDTKEVWLAGPHTFGGVPPEKLRQLDADRRTLTQAHLDLGVAAWTAFRAPAPAALADLAATDTTPLPALAAALTRHLRQYPGTRDGLGETERRGLAAIAGGRTDFVDVFMAQAEGDDPPFMGDTTFRHYLARLAAGPQPLLGIDGAGRYRVTGTGVQVLAGEANQVELNGIDRWFGGVHLTGRATWRWDGERGRLVG